MSKEISKFTLYDQLNDRIDGIDGKLQDMEELEGKESYSYQKTVSVPFASVGFPDNTL